MAAPLKYSNTWQDLVAADRVVCRSLHVGESATGAIGGAVGPGNFTTLTVTGTSSFGGNITVLAPIASSDDITCRNLTASQTVAANAVVANTLSATTAALPAITGVVTINGAPYPPPGTGAGGPTVDIAAGLVFPTMTIPAAGSGAYRVTNASLAGMANNAADPGAGNGGPAAAGLAFIADFTGDIAGRTELLLFNASSYALAFAAPIVSIHATHGRVWFPGARARATRATTASVTWVVEVDDLRFESRFLGSAADFTPRLTLPAGTALVEAGLEYALHGTSPRATDDLVCAISGVFSVRLDRTGDAAPNTAAIRLTFPVALGASANWAALAGFLPPFGTLDELEVVWNAGAYVLESRRCVGAGTAVLPAAGTAYASIGQDASFTLGIELAGITGVVDVLATVSFRFLADRYTYVAAF